MWLRALLCPELVRSHGEHWFHLGLIILREFSHRFPWWGISLVVGIWHFYFWGPRFNPWSNPWELRSHKLHSVTKKKKKKSWHLRNRKVLSGKWPTQHGAISSWGNDRRHRNASEETWPVSSSTWVCPVCCFWLWFIFSRMYHTGGVLRGDHPS